MPSKRRVSLSHLLAPIALLAFLAAFAAILLNSSVVGNDDGDETTATTEQVRTQTTKTTPAGRKLRPFYIVKLNDTLEAISRKTGVSVRRLQELNPEADPQALVAGQRLRLRE